METLNDAPQSRERIIPVSRSVVSISDRDAFEKCSVLALNWIEETAATKLSLDQAGTSFKIDIEAQATVSALRFDDEQGSIWSAQVAFAGDKNAKRRWVTDLFVEKRREGLVRFGAQLNCHVAPADPGFDHSRPRLIYNIVDALSCEVDGEQIGNQFSQVTNSNIDHFIDLLYNTSRRLPVLLVSVDDNGSAQVDIAKLARRVSGAAHLRTIDIESSFDLTRALGKRMSTFNGAVRLYMPGLEANAEDPFLHPLWLAPQSGWNRRLVSAVAERILPLGFRNLDGDAFWRLSLLRQATSRAEANALTGTTEEKLEAEIEALQAELADARTAAQSAEALMDDEAEKRTQSEAVNAQLTEQNFALRERIRLISSASNSNSISISPDDVYEVFDQSPSLEASLRVISGVFPDRIVVLQSAYEAARDSFSFTYRKKAFDLLWKLCTEYWLALSNGGNDAQARSCFGNAYAAREANTISKEGRKRRTFHYKGEEVEMEKHLKIGVADNKSDTLRIHFEWISRDDIIVVGHCGGHLNF